MNDDSSSTLEADAALASEDGDDSIHAASDGDPGETIEPTLEDE
jgi:hypothetical protein